SEKRIGKSSAGNRRPGAQAVERQLCRSRPERSRRRKPPPACRLSRSSGQAERGIKTVIAAKRRQDHRQGVRGCCATRTPLLSGVAAGRPVSGEELRHSPPSGEEWRPKSA